MKIHSTTSSFNVLKLAILGIIFLNCRVDSHHISRRELIKSISEIKPTTSQELIKISNQNPKVKNLQKINEECDCKKFSKRHLKLKKRMQCLMCGDINNKIKEEDFEYLPKKPSNPFIVITPEQKMNWRSRSLKRIKSLRIIKPPSIFDSANQSARKLVKKPLPKPKKTTTNGSPEDLSFRKSFNVDKFEDHQFPEFSRTYSDSFTFDIPLKEFN